VSEIKVTDKRMFTPDGRLREEYAREAEPAVERSDSSPEPAPPPLPAAESSRPATPPAAAPEVPAGPRLELPGTPPGLGGPSFYDLVALLAEPASLYLGDLALPDGSTAEDLDLARLHIDLLDLLRQRTAGNLSAQELAVLEDLLYRLRMRYVQKRG